MANGLLIAAGAALAAWAASKPRTDAGKTLRANPERGDGFVTGFTKDTALWGTTVNAVRPLKAPPIPNLPRPIVQMPKSDPMFEAFPYAILLFRPDVVWSGEQGTYCPPMGGNYFYSRSGFPIVGSVTVLVDPMVGGVTDAMLDAARSFVRSGAFKEVVQVAGLAYPASGLKQIAGTLATVGGAAGAVAGTLAGAAGATAAGATATATGVGIVAAGVAGAALGIASLFGTKADLPEAFEVGGYWETIVRERRAIGAAFGIGTMFSSEDGGKKQVHHLRDTTGRGVFEAFEQVAREANS